MLAYLNGAPIVRHTHIQSTRVLFFKRFVLSHGHASTIASDDGLLPKIQTLSIQASLAFWCTKAKLISADLRVILLKCTLDLPRQIELIKCQAQLHYG